MTEIIESELAGITGGNLTDLARTAYRGAVKNITAAAGGWKLANEMYGTSSLQEKWRARGAMKEFLDGSDKLPSWAPNW